MLLTFVQSYEIIFKEKRATPGQDVFGLWSNKEKQGRGDDSSQGGCLCSWSIHGGILLQ